MFKCLNLIQWNNYNIAITSVSKEWKVLIPIHFDNAKFPRQNVVNFGKASVIELI